MKLCIVLPALNEEKSVAQVIEAIPREIEGVREIVVILVDDGSHDRTRELALQAGAIVVSHPRTLGVGAAFRAGVQKALELDADLMVNMDSDGQFNAGDIPKLLAPLLSGKAGFVTASRFKDKALTPEMPWARLMGNKAMSRIISMLSGQRFYDVSCGFRAYSRDVLLRLNLFGSYTYTQETFLDLCNKDIEIAEVPISCRGVREHGQSRVAPNLIYYAVNTSNIIFRSFRDYRPARVFGSLAVVILIAGVIVGIFFAQHWYRTGMTQPHKWAGFTSAFLLLMSWLVFLTGLVADMLARIRMNQERILYLLRRHGLD